MGELLSFHFRVTHVMSINEKKSFKYYSSNVRERLEIDNTPSISKNLLGYPGMLKSRSDLDVVSSRWESIRLLFRCYIPLGAKDIQVQIFNHLKSSYLK